MTVGGAWDHPPWKKSMVVGLEWEWRALLTLPDLLYVHTERTDNHIFLHSFQIGKKISLGLGLTGRWHSNMYMQELAARLDENCKLHVWMRTYWNTKPGTVYVVVLEMLSPFRSYTSLLHISSWCRCLAMQQLSSWSYYSGDFETWWRIWLDETSVSESDHRQECRHKRNSQIDNNEPYQQRHD